MIAVALFVCLFCAFAAMSIANGKRRSGTAWFIAGLLIGPLSLVVALLPELPEPPKPMMPVNLTPDGKISLDEETKKCPACAETIKLLALKCRFCGERFPEEQVKALATDRFRELKEKLQRIQAGQKWCPWCNRWDVITANFGNGYAGDWCPNCKEHVAELYRRLNKSPLPSTSFSGHHHRKAAL